MPNQGLKQYSIEFVGATMNTTLSNDKVVPPNFVELKNVDLSDEGAFRKRFGIADSSTNASPDIPETRINAIATTLRGDLAVVANKFLVALGDDRFYYQAFKASAWATAGAAQTGADTFPYNIAWGINTSGDPRVYFANIASGVFALEGLTGNMTKYGSDDDASNPWSEAGAVEFFLDKLFVGNTKEGGTTYADRVRWSVTGDDDDFYGVGSGVQDLRVPGGGTGTLSTGIRGMRVWRNNLYIASFSTLHVLVGTTSSTFGFKEVIDIRGIVGSTFYEVDNFLWWICYDGIYQFDGARATNVLSRSMKRRFNSLNYLEIGLATASWDDYYGIYKIFFPTTAEEWNYHYRTNQWSINTFGASDAIRVISPPTSRAGGVPSEYAIGAVTNGKVFRMESDETNDDGTAFTASFKTGHIPLAGPGGEFELQFVDIYAARQDVAGTITIDVSIDGATATTMTYTVTDAGASAETFPQRFTPDDLPAHRVGEFIELELKDATASHRCDIRRVDLWYKVVPGRKVA